MAIPGLRPTFQVRAKVRVGKKNERGLPTSTDYFVCDEVPQKTSELRIFFPHQSVDDNFSTGMEWWRGKQLTCYSKGEGEPPLAYRVKDMVGDAEVRGEPMGRDRIPITCPVRDCAFVKEKSCKPMGRLIFWIDGLDRRQGVFQLDTKGWHSIENLLAVLSQYPDLRGIPFKLSVSFTQKGTSRFPVLTLEEDMEVNNDADIAKADALVQLRKVLEVGSDESEIRLALATALNETNPGWRDRPDFIGRIKEVGVTKAAEGLLGRYEL